MQGNESQAENLWRIVAGRLLRYNANLYEMWFQKMTPLRTEKSTLILGVTDDFFADFVGDNYADILEKALHDLNGADYSWRFESGHPAPQIPLVEAEKVPAPATPKPLPPTAPSGSCRPHLRSSGFTFDNFIVGDENRHAFTAAKTASEAPGLYNPLFIYGANGIGKTHLLQAVAHAVREHNPGAVIRSTTCDELLNEFYDLLWQKKSLAEFRASVRDVDVLLIDDVHRLAKKVQMQEEFFNLFNTLYDQGRQIILTSDRQPCEMSDIDKRLTTRFESGMITEVVPPEYETRLAILRLWRTEVVTDYPLGDEFLDFLATNIRSSVRRLKGCFLRLATWASINGGDRLTLECAENLLRGQIDQEYAARDVSIETIQKQVAEHYNVTIPDLLGRGKCKRLAEPRMAAMYLACELTKCSSTEIGRAFGRTHATILHARNKLPELCRGNELLRHSVEQIRHQLQKN
ncbi:MAG: chromosomal replication initiator protein DnaA [Victivallaceae bacterium]|nr:chromosomal replication initiator protein DnaA [Victivallaceae bacterium]